MKHALKNIVFLGAALTSGLAAAEWNNDLCNNVGVDYKWTNIKGSGGYASVFPKSSSGASIYYGNRFSENFGVELGYDWSGKKSRSFTTTTPFTTLITDIFDDEIASIPETLTTTINTNLRLSQLRLDFNGYMPVGCEGLELLGSVGIGFVSSRINQTILETESGGSVIDGGITFTSPALSTTRNLSSSTTKTIWRLGVGAQYMMTCNVGIRGMYRYEGLSGLKVKNIDTLRTTSGFKNSSAFTLGLFYKF